MNRRSPHSHTARRAAAFALLPVLMFVFAAFTGCQQTDIYTVYQPVNTAAWEGNDKLEFDLGPIAEDGDYALSLQVRTTAVNAYPYKDLIVEVRQLWSRDDDAAKDSLRHVNDSLSRVHRDQIAANDQRVAANDRKISFNRLAADDEDAPKAGAADEGSDNKSESTEGSGEKATKKKEGSQDDDNDNDGDKKSSKKKKSKKSKKSDKEKSKEKPDKEKSKKKKSGSKKDGSSKSSKKSGKSKLAKSKGHTERDSIMAISDSLDAASDKLRAVVQQMEAANDSIAAERAHRIAIDTVSIPLADDNKDVTGIAVRQYNTHVGTLHLQAGQKAHIIIRHIMRLDALPGISDIGVTLEKI